MIRLLASLFLLIALTGASTSVNVPITVNQVQTPTAIAIGGDGCSSTACTVPNIDNYTAFSSSTPTGLPPTGTYVGTLSTTVSGTPPFSGSYSLVAHTTGDNCGTGTINNTPFRIASTDQLQYNTGATRGTTYNVCIKATTGTASTTQEFSISVYNVVNAALTYCAANGGGDGSSGNPWLDTCIIAAIGAASTGDTVFLAAGNWNLRLTTANPTGNITSGTAAVTGLSSVTGIVVGETVADNTSIQQGGNYPSSSHNFPGDPGQKTFAPTVTAINSGCSPTPCVSLTAAPTATATGNTNTFGFGWPIVTNKIFTLMGAGSGNTFDAAGHPNNGQPPSTAAGATRVYTSGTPVYQPGGFISFYNSAGTPGPVVSHILFDGTNAIAGNQSDGGGDFSGIINFVYCNNPTVNDIRVFSFINAGLMPNAQYFVFGDGSHGSSTTMNSIIANSFVSGTGYSGGQTLQEQDHNTATYDNNLFYQGGLNPIYLDNMSFTRSSEMMFNDSIGNVQVVPTYGPAGCANSGCSFVGTTGDIHLYTRNNLFYSPSLTFGFGPNVNDPGTNGIVNDVQFSGNWVVAASAYAAACAWRFQDSTCLPTGSPDTSNPSAAMQVDTLSFTNNSIAGSSTVHIDFQGNGCGSNPVNPGQGSSGCAAVSGTLPTGENWMTCNTCSASQNYLSGPSNQYLTDTHSVSPSQTNNYCNTSSFSGCNTTGFTTSPTVSFALGNLYEVGSTYYVPLTNESFTAQYGAVQWLASTSSTAPLSSDARWSSNNSSFPQGQLNTYVPPVSLSGVAHGSTVYLWVMDSANQIGSATPQVVP